jgi:hypothetical protein
VVEFPPSLTQICKRSEVDIRIHGYNQEDNMSPAPLLDEKEACDDLGTNLSNLSLIQAQGRSIADCLEKIFGVWVAETPTARGKSFILHLSPKEIARCMMLSKTFYKLLSSKDAIFWVSYLGYAFCDNVCPKAVNPCKVFLKLRAEIQSPKWENSRCAQPLPPTSADLILCSDYFDGSLLCRLVQAGVQCSGGGISNEVNEQVKHLKNFTQLRVSFNEENSADFWRNWLSDLLQVLPCFVV